MLAYSINQEKYLHKFLEDGNIPLDNNYAEQAIRPFTMSNARIQQIVTLLYMHKEIVSSSGVHTEEAKGLHEVMDRAYKNRDYYKNNPMLKSTFDFLKMVVDSWFAHE